MNEKVNKLMDNILNDVVEMQKEVLGETMNERADRRLAGLRNLMQQIDNLLEEGNLGEHEIQLLMLKGRISKSITLIEFFGPIAALL